MSDAVNSLFQLGGSFAVIWTAIILFDAKEIRGVSVASTVFMALWGFWNLYYYPSLEQWFSFAAAVVMAAANTVRVIGMIWFTIHPGGKHSGRLTVDI